MPRKLKIDNLDDLIRRYQGGESLKQLSVEAGVSRGYLTKNGVWCPSGLMGAFVSAGVQLRGRSEAERTKWSRMGKAQRSAQVGAAHRARRGSADPEHRRAARARTNHIRLNRAAPVEHPVAAALRLAGVEVAQQFPFGRYNLDMAVERLLVAVEIEDCWSGGNYPGELFERTKRLLDGNWCVVFVLGKLIDPAHVTQQILTMLDALSRNESLRGKYWVVGSNPKAHPRGTAKLDGLPRILRLESD
jgi:very-short-patch-repair endonuclease